jgi:prepilin-type processing-associated H-X9-DG protein
MTRHAVSCFELLILFAVAAIVGLILLPSLCAVDNRAARRALCGSNQRQVLMAMEQYDSERHTWPCFTAAADGHQVSAIDLSLDPTATAIASLEFLAARNPDLIPKTFTCPAHRDAKPDAQAAPGLGITVWNSPWAKAGAAHIGYRYDWSVPASAASVRVVTADRAAEGHQGKVVAGYADGHVAILKLENNQVRNPEAGDDDITDSTDDGPMRLPGGGSATRAWVR